MRMLVAAHTLAEVPRDDFYLPIHCGHALDPSDLGMQPDDEGDNISDLNPEYSELTALYWAWRNLPSSAVAIGLSHYRRYFRGTQPGPSGARILSAPEATAALDGVDIVLAKPRHYLVETIGSHYANAHHSSDLAALRAAVAAVSPEVGPSLEAFLSQRRMAQFHMFLMRRDDLDRYCTWLFAVLAETGRRIDLADRTPYQRRALGFLGERLLNVWVTHCNLTIRHLPVATTEREPRLAKALNLARRRLHGPNSAHDRES